MPRSPSSETHDSARSARIDALAGRLGHPDPLQLAFQLAEIAGDELYLRHGVDVRAGDVVLDVGANVGVAAAYFAIHRRAGLVHCFEPVAPICEVLRANVADLPACVVHEQGLGRAAGRVPITYYPRAAAMSGLYADPSRDRALVRRVLANAGVGAEEAEQRLADAYDSETLTCELRTLSSFLAESRLERVHLLKIDVERAELDVLDGIADADWGRIEQLVIEVHDEDGRGAAIAGRLSARAYRVVLADEPVMRGTDVRVAYATRR